MAKQKDLKYDNHTIFNKNKRDFLLIESIQMLPKNKIKEGIGISYVKAICNRAGYNLAIDENDFGCDITIRDLMIRDSGRTFWSGFNLDVQLKCTENWRENDDNIIFDLKNKNYNDLLENNQGATKRMLVVMLMAKEQDKWIDHSTESLIIRKCAYWKSLVGMTPVEDIKSTTAISIPKTNLFSQNTIEEIMQKIKQGEEINE